MGDTVDKNIIHNTLYELRDKIDLIRNEIILINEKMDLIINQLDNDVKIKPENSKEFKKGLNLNLKNSTFVIENQFTKTKKPCAKLKNTVSKDPPELISSTKSSKKRARRGTCIETYKVFPNEIKQYFIVGDSIINSFEVTREELKRIILKNCQLPNNFNDGKIMIDLNEKMRSLYDSVMETKLEMNDSISAIEIEIFVNKLWKDKGKQNNILYYINKLIGFNII